MMNEHQLEKQCLAWFEQSGWEVVHGSTINLDGANPQRASASEVILRHDLRSAFNRINPHLPVEYQDLCCEQVFAKLNKPESMDLITNNKAFHGLLLNGVPVEYKVPNERGENEVKKEQAFIVDFEHFENNRFVVINQVNISGTKQIRIPDIICYINGLPFAVLELKSPSDENTDIWHAFNQLQTYKDEIANLFIYNEALVISDGYTARVGSLTASEERFMPWRTMENERQTPTQIEWQIQTLIHDFFDRERFLDYIRFFVLFENDGGNIIKKIAGSHQVHAVEAAIKSTIMASQEVAAPPEQNNQGSQYKINTQAGSKKAGVIWHTQGSGKSFSMCCYAGKLVQQAAMNNPTLVVVTDRNDLDNQLFTTFSNAADLLRQCPVQANDRQTLRKLLAERESGGIIFTTVQKFTLLDGETTHPVLNSRHNIVVISDEAHRSHYDTPTKSIRADGTYKSGYAKYLRDALPWASFIGFTGTPISYDDRDTQAVFGEYVSIYDIKDAVEDQATVGIYYESRLVKLDINSAEIEALSAQVEEVIEDEEDTAIREKTKSTWSQLEKLVGAAPRLQRLAKDLVAHFEARNAIARGKGMIVGMSRAICVQLYDEIIAIRPDWHDHDPEKGAIKIIMTGSASDIGTLQPHIYNKDTKKRLAKRFKDAADPLQLVIVRDMWLTGFDVPCCHTMYIDKPMKGHNLMQAIARVNRVFKDKADGLVVDYIGIASELKHAFKIYADSKGKGAPTLDIEEAFKILEEKMATIRKMFMKAPETAGLDISAFETDTLKLLVLAANYILGLPDGKKRFFDAVLAATKAYALCGSFDAAKPLHKEIAFYAAIKASISKFSGTTTKRSQAEKESILKQILDNAIVSDGVADIFDLCGLEKANIALLSDEFLEEVRQLPTRNLAIELLERLIKDKIRSKGRTNIVQEKKYADRLKETLRKYHNRAIETAEVIDALIRMAKEFQEELLREEALGLNPDEIAFYTALANNESAVRELGDEILKKIAVEITEKLRKSTTVDWQVRDSVRAELRILVRRTLQRWKYPPDGTPEAVELVLEQAEVLSNSWTR